MEGWYNLRYQNDGPYEYFLYWISSPNSDLNPFTKDIILHPIVSETKIEGYIKDNNGSIPVSNFNTFDLQRDDQLVVWSGMVGSNETENAYYNSATGYYCVKNILAGGTYTLKLYFTEYSYYEFSLIAPPGETTIHNVTLIPQ